MITQEMMDFWKEYPATIEFFKLIKEEIESYREFLTNGSTMNDQILNAKLIGMVEAFNIVLNIKLSDITGEESDVE